MGEHRRLAWAAVFFGCVAEPSSDAGTATETDDAGDETGGGTTGDGTTGGGTTGGGTTGGGTTGGGTTSGGTTSDGDPSETSASASSSDGSTEGGDACTPAPSDFDWLVDYQDRLVAQLSGARPWPGGETSTGRSTTSERAAAADRLVDEIEALGLAAKRHAYAPDGENVYAELPATDGSATVVVLGAHYDAVPGAPGANDNATGVAMVLAVARHLLELPCRRGNVVFVLFDQEEDGLIGSAAFADLLVEADLPIHSVHTIDQMGWDADGDRAVELERADEGLHQLYAAAADEAGLDVPLTPTNTGSTDHVSFRAAGFPAIGITEEYVSGDTTPHYHTPGDTYETVEVEYTASSTKLVAAVFARLLQAP